MAHLRENELVARVERLERANRRLVAVCSLSLVAPVLALVGWRQVPQQPPLPDTLRVSRLEVVDPKGVPLVTLSTGRSHEGGAITLRDKLGERRAWWTASPAGSSLALTRERDPKADGVNTAGFSVSQNSAEMNLMGPQGAMLSATVREDQPRLDLWSSTGATLFGAPWKVPAPRRR